MDYYPTNSQVKVLCANSGAGLESEINAWLTKTKEENRVFHIDVKTHGTLLWAMITFEPPDDTDDPAPRRFFRGGYE